MFKRKNIFFAFLIILAALCLFCLIRPSYSDNETFVQSDWSGGSSVNPATQTGWDKYFFKNTEIVVPAGQVSLDTESFSLTDTTDVDFGAGTKDELVINGTGTGASLVLDTTVDDIFVNNQLGKWASLNEMPALSWFSAYARIVHDNKVYIYAFWERNIFGRYSVSEKKWEFLANAPRSVGPGCSLAYPGSGDFIYAIRGGEQKSFWKYSISTDTWTTLADTLYSIRVGGSIAATSTKIFCVVGSSNYFLEYDIATNVWIERPVLHTDCGTSSTAGPDYQSQLVYPGTGNFIFLNRGGSSGNFCAYNMSPLIRSWTNFKPQNASVQLNDLSYPGSGDYLYAWRSSLSSGTLKNFLRYKFRGDGGGLTTTEWETLPEIPTYAYKGILVDSDPTVTPSSPSSEQLYLFSAGHYSDMPLKFNTTTLKWNVINNRAVGLPHYGGRLVSDGAGNIYGTAGYATNPFYHYSIANDVWTAKTVAPFTIYYGSDLAYTPGYVYALQGYNTTGFARYIIASDTWETLTPTPTPTPNVGVGWGGSLVAVGEDLYAIPSGGTSYFWKYTKSTESWSTSFITMQSFVTGWKTFSGSGLNDLTVVGGQLYTGTTPLTYRVQIDGTGSPNTFKWSKDGGTTWIASNVAITGAEQLLDNGVKIVFGATTGHTSGNYWNFLASNGLPGTVSYNAGLCYPGEGDQGENYIYVVRGNATKTFWKYDIATNTWGAMADMPVFSSGSYKTQMTYPGSGEYIYVYPENYTYLLRYKFKGENKNTWEFINKNEENGNAVSNNLVPNSIPGSGQFAMVAAGDKIYFHTMSDAQLFDYTISTGLWSERMVEYTRPGRYFGNLIYYAPDNAVYMFKGFHSKTIFKYSLSDDKWVGAFSAPFFFDYGTKAVYPGSGNYIYVTEGNLTNRFWRYDITQNQWTRMASSVLFFDGAQIASGGGYIYAMSGINYTNATASQTSVSFYRYNIANDGWEALQNLDANTNITTSSPRGNRLIYVPEGAQGALYYKVGKDTALLYRYDVALNTWQQKASSSVTTQNGSIVYYATNNEIYYFSGSNSKFQKYSITSNQWTSLANPPFGVGYSLIDSDLFYPGAGDFIYLSDSQQRFFARYSISLNDWDIPVTLPNSQLVDTYSFISSGENSNTIYAGGYSNFWKYDVGLRTWTVLSSPPNTWTTGAQTIYPGTGDFLYSTRGYNTNSLWRYNISLNIWDVLASPASNFLYGHKIVGTSNKIYAFFGGSLTTFRAYDIGLNFWSDMTPAPGTVYYGSTLCYLTVPKEENNQIVMKEYIYATRGNATSDFWRYDISGNSWQVLTSVPVLLGNGSSGGTSLVYPKAGDYLYLTQGPLYSYYGSTATIFKYSLSNNTWEEVENLSPQQFFGYGDLFYPGEGDYLYGHKGVGRYDLSKFLLFKRGAYTSEVKRVGGNKEFGAVSFDNLPNDSMFEFKAATSNSISMSGVDWNAVPVIRNDQDLSAAFPYVTDGHTYLQYKMNVFADSLDPVPEIDSVTMSYLKYPARSELISSAYNSQTINNRIKDISWSDDLPEGTGLRFQLSTSSNGTTWSDWYGPSGTQFFTDDYDNEDDYSYDEDLITVNANGNGQAKLKEIAEGFQYTQRITVDNSSGTRSYQNVGIHIEITSDNKDFWANVKDDGSDVRFFDGSGTQLAYNLSTNGCSFDHDNKYAKILIIVPVLDSGEKETIYLKYGKADAVSESNSTLSSFSFDGLAGYWPFNEGSGTITADLSGNGNNGVLAGATLSWDTDGTRGVHLNFNATGISTNYVNAGNSQSLKITGNQTIAMWVNPVNFSTTRNVFNKAYGGEGMIAIQTNGFPLYYYGTSGLNGSPFQSYAMAGANCTALTPGTWTHIAIVRDLTNMKLKWYKNGQACTEANASYSSATASNNNFLMGVGTSASLYGRMDDFFIYNKALSPSEINSLILGTASTAIPYYFNSVEAYTTSPSLSGWEYREEIKIDNTDGDELTNYQIKVSLTPGNDGFWSKCRNDGYDIRFVDSDNTTILNYARTSFNYASNTATLWVKVPSVAAGTIKTIYMYYGKSDAADTSNFDNTLTKNFDEDSGSETLKALYHMDEGAGTTTADSSGNSNTLTRQACDWSTTDLTGFSTGKSLSFNGTNAYAQAADSASLDIAGSTITLEAWIRPTSVTGNRTIILKGNDSASSINYMLRLTDSRLSFIFYNGSLQSISTNLGVIAANQTQHVVVTYNQAAGSNQVSFYVNGALVHQGTNTTLMLANADAFFIGRNTATGLNAFAGLIDEVRIYNRVLSATEVLRHYEHRSYYVNAPQEAYIYEVETPPAYSFPVSNPTVQPVFGVFYSNGNIAEFQETATKPNNTEIKYQLSPDGYSWFWFNGSSWVPVTYGYTNANTATQVNSNLSSYLSLFPNADFYYRAFLHVTPGVYSTPILEQVKTTLTTSESYYVTNSGGNNINLFHADAANDQWFRYKAILYSDGQNAPTLNDVTVSYIDAYLTLLTPNGGEQINVATQYEITWESQEITGPTGFVKLEYSLDNGSTWTLIANNLPNTGSYMWTLPSTGSNLAKIKISSVDFPAVTDQSDAVFSIMALRITSPNGGEIVEQGKSRNILWDRVGTVENNLVNIHYSLNNGTSWVSIATAVPNLGTHSWLVPVGVDKESDQVLVRVSSTVNSNISDASDAVFSIVPQPVLTITSPAGEENWSIGTQQTISWTTNTRDFSDEVIIEYSTDGFDQEVYFVDPNPVSIGSPSGANANADIIGSYQWTIPNDAVVADDVQIRIRETQVPPGRQTATIVSDISEVFSLSEPSITILSPNANSVWVVGDENNITWESIGAVSDNLLLEYKVGEEGSWIIINDMDGEDPIGEENDGSFDWTVPEGAVGESVYIRITDLNRDQVKGLSSVFRVLGEMTFVVIQPNGGEELTVGAGYSIQWQSYGKKLDAGGSDYNAINIFYSSNNGENWTQIASEMPNTKSFLWNPIPDDETEDALIKIVNGANTLITDSSDAVFSIVPPVITVTTPNGGETIYANGIYEIKWTSFGGISNNLKLQYSTNGVDWIDIATGQSNTGSYIWNPVADINSAQVKIKIIDKDRPALAAEVSDVSDAVFSVIPPTITVVSPNGGEDLPIGIVHPIQWTTTGHGQGALRNITIHYSTNGGSTWTLIAEGLSVSEAGQGTYNWTIPDAVSANCLIKIFDATRLATTDTSNAVFHIVLPYITITAPTAGNQWPKGSLREVTWASVGDVNNLNIFYAIQTDGTWGAWQALASDVVNDGSETVTVPNIIAPIVKIKIQDIGRPAVLKESSVFSIVSPQIRVIIPNGGNLWTVGDQEEIIWENIGNVGNNLKFEYSKNNFDLGNNDIIEVFPNVTQNTPNTVDNKAVWTIPNDVSSTVRVRITDTADVLTTDKSDLPFTILPAPIITITSPQNGDVWRVGDVKDIIWTDNGGLVSNNLTLEYSSNNGTTWNLIGTGIANTRSYSWTIPDTLSVQCKIRIQDPSRDPATTGESSVFEIANPLITITSPNGGEKWAVNDNAPITWTTTGSVSNNLLLQYSVGGAYVTAQNPQGQLATSVANTGSYTWKVPDNISNNVLFKIIDNNRPAVVDYSDDVFSIISVPRFVNIDIGPGIDPKEFILGDVVNIIWQSQGLAISNNLIIEASNDNFNTTAIIATGVSNTGLYTWTIPEDALTGATLKIRITDANRTAITGTYEGTFRIRGGFVLTSPNGAEYWIANSNHSITWTTRGNIPRIKLQYTTNNGASWTSIITNIENIGSYNWILPADVQSDTVKVRITDSADDSVYDISNEDFLIKRATVRFNVLDFDSLQHLSDFSVNEPATGWSDSGLNSPLERNQIYRYGTYTTFFTKVNYIDSSVTWNPPKEGNSPYVITVYLENAASAQISWEAILSYSYSPADDVLNCVGSLQRKGKLVGVTEAERQRMGGATIRIYEPDGETIRQTLTANAPNTSGMYTFTYANTDFESGKVYPTTLAIVYNDQAYTSSANIDVGAEKLQYEFFTQTATKLASSVEEIREAVAGGTAQTRQDIEASRQQLTADLISTKADIQNYVSGILSSTETTLTEKIEETRQQSELAMRSEILNTESVVRANDSLVIRYRTYSGLIPTLDLYDTKNVQRINKAQMKEVGTTGIYEYEVKFLNSWGKGEVSIICSESTKGSLDALVITIVSTDLDQISSQVSAILGATTGLSEFKETAAVMDSQLSMVEQALSKLSKDLVREVKAASTSSSFDAIFRQLSGVQDQMKQLSGNQDVNLEKLYTLSEDRKNDMKYLKNKTQELKAVMEINRKMVDNIANKPITQAWYEYK